MKGLKDKGMKEKRRYEGEEERREKPSFVKYGEVFAAALLPALLSLPDLHLPEPNSLHTGHLCGQTQALLLPGGGKASL